jgi:hypothetical protein
MWIMGLFHSFANLLLHHPGGLVGAARSVFDLDQRRLPASERVAPHKKPRADTKSSEFGISSVRQERGYDRDESDAAGLISFLGG